MAKRRLHLGIDYGTSTSKIVFRDYGARGEEKAYLVLRNGEFRIPSRVCATATDLIFGDGSRTDSDCDIYHSIKMRAAAEASEDPSLYFGLQNAIPVGLTASDFAALTLWFLISEGHRAIKTYLGGSLEGVAVGMTMGVPMSFFANQRLRNTFLQIARLGWILYRNEGLLEASCSIDRAARLLPKYIDHSATPIPEFEMRDWIRSEAEAAMWWPFQSPAIAPGPYAKVDIGAGTTHASLYRIFDDHHGVKRGLAFFGAVSVAHGMDAVDRAIADYQQLGGDCFALRGLEEAILKSDAKARGALIPVKDDIYEAYRKAWIETYQKIGSSISEVRAWHDHRIFVIGGGSLVSLLVEHVRSIRGVIPFKLLHGRSNRPISFARMVLQLAARNCLSLRLHTVYLILGCRYQRRTDRIKSRQWGITAPKSGTGWIERTYTLSEASEAFF